MIVEKLNEEYATQAASEALMPFYPRPSALGGCMREMAHRLAGMPAEPRTPESMRLLELGHQRGEELERRAKTCWPDAETQVAVQVPTPWGSMPGTVDLWIPSLRTIVDFKTAGAYSMGLVVSGEKEDEGYALQLNAYRHGIQAKQTGLPALHEIRTILVYEAKDSDLPGYGKPKRFTAGMLHEVEVPYSPDLEERYQARLKEIALLLGGNIKPEFVSGVYGIKGQDWRCRMKDGRPLYCSVGTIRGSCS
jgi:hypothetical protein